MLKALLNFLKSDEFLFYKIGAIILIMSFLEWDGASKFPETIFVPNWYIFSIGALSSLISVIYSFRYYLLRPLILKNLDITKSIDISSESKCHITETDAMSQINHTPKFQLVIENPTEYLYYNSIEDANDLVKQMEEMINPSKPLWFQSLNCITNFLEKL